MPGVPPSRFAYLGPEGTFAEQALRTIPSTSSATLLPESGVAAVCAVVRSGDADHGLVPLENSVEGAVAASTDELVQGEPLLITREVFLPVTFVLLVRPGTELADVRTVTTHPHAEAQVRRWLAAHVPAASYVAAGSTSDGAARVARGEYDASVSAPLAAKHHRLRVLATAIEDNPGAVTRFGLLSRPAPPTAPTGNDKTTFVAFISDDHTGALHEVLTELAVRGINLTRIESRPSRAGIGQYHFVLECDGHILDPRVGEALAALHRIGAGVRFLGSYPRADRAGSAPAARDSDGAFADAAAWLARVRAGGVE